MPGDEEPVCAQDEGKVPFSCWKTRINAEKTKTNKKVKIDMPPSMKYATNSEVFAYPTTPKASPVAWDAKRIVTWKRMTV